MSSRATFERLYTAALHTLLTEPSPEAARKCHEAATCLAEAATAELDRRYGPEEAATAEPDRRYGPEEAETGAHLSKLYAALYPDTGDVAAFVADIGHASAVDDMLARVSELRTALDTARELAEERWERLDQRISEVDTLTEELASTHRELANAQAEIASLKAELREREHAAACPPVYDHPIQLPARDDVG